jgi:hypothetical protein
MLDQNAKQDAPFASRTSATDSGAHRAYQLHQRVAVRQGIRGVEPRLRRTRIDFFALRTGEGLPLPARLCAELEREHACLNLVETQLRAAEAERDTADAQDPSVERKRDMLIQLRRVAPASAAILAREIYGRHFANRRQVASDLGRTPSAYDSASTICCEGISKADNGFRATRHDRGRMALAEISARQRSDQMVRRPSGRSTAAYLSHHVGRSGTQTHRRSLALCRNRSRP